MIRKVFLQLLLVLVTVSSVRGFASSAALSGVNGGSTFVTAPARMSTVAAPPSIEYSKSGVASLHMGGKQAKFGVFSIPVYVAKFVLGTKKLNSIRGKAISLHSQAIGDFCKWSGAYHLRTRLIKLAKTNGDTLGFLV
mmetsp:Transcript_9671/g.11981  ORF Transcript_9671/g.11981 Transcript_9671/m.11981 type:complete len:138 (-) Transcript_9671:216-629(-)|eukprot:CAMPEP_0172491304 /NCGR_PEP_ID=MMETSP1066-20121228/22059_1 /TAXON_ID=671091 /ORGANISM="Coscinodiscus wailesii, Strain CCMP2513" /LENGTH=137 /DNA_ID=CAMNT_0013260279 /DNA_START=181 /DNA_END=594 /DNA_ORIENTATION=+